MPPLNTNGQLQWAGVADTLNARDVNLICISGGFWREPTRLDYADAIYELVHADVFDGVILNNVLYSFEDETIATLRQLIARQLTPTCELSGMPAGDSVWDRRT